MNFKWNPEKATILLAVPKPDIDPRVISYAAEFGYREKLEFHASIIGLQNGKKIIEKHKDNKDLIDQIKALAESYQWEIICLPEYFIIEKYYDITELEKSGYKDIPPQMRKTIIQKIELPNIQVFYTELSKLTGLDFEIPFAHITLFAWSNYEPMMTQGIGLYSNADFEKYKKEEILL